MKKKAIQAQVEPVVRMPIRGKQPTGYLNQWDQDAEVNDRVVDRFSGKLYRLVASNGWGKRNSGELTPREIKAPEPGMRVVKVNNIWMWEAF